MFREYNIGLKLSMHFFCNNERGSKFDAYKYVSKIYSDGNKMFSFQTEDIFLDT